MYVIMAFDKPDSQALRLENRAEHVAYVLAQDGVKTAGPFTSDDGDTMIGTLLLLDVCLLYTSPSPRDRTRSRMPSSA